MGPGRACCLSYWFGPISNSLIVDAPTLGKREKDMRVKFVDGISTSFYL
jgi:hypothetical protein